MRTWRGLTMLEIVVVIAIIAILAVLVMPTLSSSRESSRRTQCASNIRQLLTAMYLYSDSVPSRGLFPTLSTSGDDPLAQFQPTSEALNLLYPDYVSDPRVFVCVSDPTRPSPVFVQQIPKWSRSGQKGSKPKTRMTPDQTSYAYDPGHSTNISSMVALISDKPGANGNSDNHGPAAGQNVGFGTSVEFRETVKNPLEEGAMDNSIFTLGDTTPGTNGIKVSRDEDSYIRR